MPASVQRTAFADIDRSDLLQLLFTGAKGGKRAARLCALGLHALPQAGGSVQGGCGREKIVRHCGFGFQQALGNDLTDLGVGDVLVEVSL